MPSSKVALVTGAGHGIGAATAKRLAADGYAVCVNYRTSRKKAEEVVHAIKQTGGNAMAIRADIGHEADILRMFEEADKALGPVSALVNNAAFNIGAVPVEELSWEALDSVYRVNVFGLITCCREAMKRMMRSGGGSIVNISSEAGKFGGNRMTAYASSKAAVNTFTIGFAREAAAHNIRVNAISPGVIDTEAHEGVPLERLRALESSIPLGRLGTAGEVAETVAWLVSDKACYVAGAVLSVTGAR